jgi:hypothetical protein
VSESPQSSTPESQPQASKVSYMIAMIAFLNAGSLVSSAFIDGDLMPKVVATAIINGVGGLVFWVLISSRSRPPHPREVRGAGIGACVLLILALVAHLST